MDKKRILAVQLLYREEGWTQTTRQALDAAGITQVLPADREGVGNMSRAFNHAWLQAHATIPEKFDFVWFVTNVTFPPDMPEKLLALFDKTTAAVHPRMDSDHPHLRDGGQGVPFIELTAPMFSVSALISVGMMDEDLPYWGMDLDWSYRATTKGFSLHVHGETKIQHRYLRHFAPQPISKVRAERRKLYDAATEYRLREKYGTEWIKKLWPTHPHAKGKKQTIHL